MVYYTPLITQHLGGVTLNDSSWIEAVSYDNWNETLAVETKSGDIYTYSNVPGSVAESMDDADSKGSFHNSEIRGQYDCVKG